MSRELLSESQLDERLLLATSEEGERAAKEQRREEGQGPHGA